MPFFPETQLSRVSLFSYLSILLLPSFPINGQLFECHSCFAGCPNATECDCTRRSNGGGTCEGQFCYVRLDILSENGEGGMSKGCSNVAPNQYLGTCQYVNDKNTVECYCQGDWCNTATKLHQYSVHPLPLISCCQCDGLDWENGTLDCSTGTCPLNCTGHYCYNDIRKQSQGCGWGHPMARRLLRNTRPIEHSDPQLFPDHANVTCLDGYADSTNFLRGCTCHYDFCNTIATANDIEQNKTQSSRSDGQNYCYAVHHVSDNPITLDTFRPSTTCQAQFCFITLTTTVITYGHSDNNHSSWKSNQNRSQSFNSTIRNKIRRILHEAIPRLETRYELTAGCLLVDDDRKAEIGCTSQWTKTENEPDRKHCICTGHICNFLHLITGEDRRKYLAFDWKTSKDYKTVSDAVPSRSITFLLILLFIASWILL